MNEPVLATVVLGDLRLRTATWGSERPDIVMLHDGLGSITQWRDVPGRVAQRTGRTVMAYERAGHGESLPTPSGPWPTNWLDREAGVLDALITQLGLVEPLLVGHSDGGSTALLHATTAGTTITGVLAIAPHSWVEDICYESIVGMRANRGAIEIGLARHHQHPHELFEAWSGVWVSDAFRTWDIRPRLSSIQVPTLIAQGVEDAYASDDQAILTAQSVGEFGTHRLVPDVGHIMHHDDADVVVDMIVDFSQDVLK